MRYRSRIAILLLSVVSGFYAATHLTVDTDIDHMLPSHLGWRQNELALDAAFPQNVDLMVVVIDGQTGDLADRAARDLAARMRARPDLFTYVRRPDGGEFFDRNGPLFLSAAELQNISDKIDRGAAADRDAGARSEPARPVRHAGAVRQGRRNG